MRQGRWRQRVWGVLAAACIGVVGGCGSDAIVHVTWVDGDGADGADIAELADIADDSGIDCNLVGCAQPPACGTVCTAVCGCCGCTPGSGSCTSEREYVICGAAGDCQSRGLCPHGTVCAVEQDRPACVLPLLDGDQDSDEIDGDGDQDGDGTQDTDIDEQSDETIDETPLSATLTVTTLAGGGFPLDGLPVRLYQALDTMPFALVFTDDQGRARFTDLSPAAYTVQVESCADCQRETHRENLVLAAGQQLDITVFFAGLGSVEGTVLLEGRDDHRGVEAVDQESGVQAVSDRDGRYLLPGLPEGTHRIAFELPGFVGQEKTVTVVFRQATVLPPFTLAALSETMGAVKGCARLFNRTSHEAVTVGLYPPFIEEPVATTQAGADCQFTLTDVPPGTYRLAAQSPEYHDQVLSAVAVTAGRATDVGVLTLRYLALYRAGAFEQSLMTTTDDQGLLLMEANGDSYDRLLYLALDDPDAQTVMVAPFVAPSSVRLIYQDASLVFAYPYAPLDNTQDLWQAPQDGSREPRRVAEKIYPSYTLDSGSGRLLFQRNFHPLERTGSLWSSSLDSGDEVKLSEEALSSYVYISATDQVVFQEPHGATLNRADYLLADLANGDTALLAESCYRGNMQFFPDGRHMALFSMHDESNVGDLVRVDLREPSTGPVSLMPSVWVDFLRFTGGGGMALAFRDMTYEVGDLYAVALDHDALPLESPHLVGASMWRTPLRILSTEQSMVGFRQTADDQCNPVLVQWMLDGSGSRDFTCNLSMHTMVFQDAERYIYLLRYQNFNDAALVKVDRSSSAVTTVAEHLYGGSVVFTFDGAQVLYFQSFDSLQQRGDLTIQAVDAPASEARVLALDVYYSYALLQGGRSLLALTGYRGGQATLSRIELADGTATELARDLSTGSYRVSGDSVYFVRGTGLMVTALAGGYEPLLLMDQTPPNLGLMLLDGDRRVFYFVWQEPTAPFGTTGLYRLDLPTLAWEGDGLGR